MKPGSIRCRRSEAEQRGRHQRRQRGVCQHGGIDANRIQTRQAGGRNRAQLVNAQPREPQSQQRAAEGQQHGFGERLADQAPPTAAQRRADGQLALAQRRPHQQQVRHIRAGDQQQKNDRAHQRQQRGTHLFHDMLVHRFQADDEARCLLDSELLAQIGGHAIHSRLRLLARDAVLQTPDGSPLHVVAVGVIVGETAREPDVRPRLNVGVGRKQQFEAGLQHAHDLRAALPADRARHGMPDDVGIRPEAPLPVRVAQDRHLRQAYGRLRGRRSGGRRGGLRLSIAVVEVAAHRDSPAHHLKKVRRHRGPTDLFRRAILARHPGTAGIDGAQRFELARGAVAHVQEVGVGEREILHVALAHVGNGEAQPVRILVRKRPQQHRIGHAEDGCAGADPQRDGDDSGGGKHGTLGQSPGGVREVSQQYPCTSGLQDTSVAHALMRAVSRLVSTPAALRARQASNLAAGLAK